MPSYKAGAGGELAAVQKETSLFSGLHNVLGVLI